MHKTQFKSQLKQSAGIALQFRVKGGEHPTTVIVLTVLAISIKI
jgi:hypothetical protein